MSRLVVLLVPLLALAVDIHQPGIVQHYTPEVDVDPHYIGFSNGYSIDTRVGDPALPVALRTAGTETDGYFLIQLEGPVYSEWTRGVKALGFEVLGYFPNYTMLVWGARENLIPVRQLPYVKWTGDYHPGYKIQRELLSASGQARVTAQLFVNASVDAVLDQMAGLGFEVVEVVRHELGSTIDVVLDLSQVAALARIPGVIWIQRWSEPELFNSNSQWVCQSGYRSSAPSPTDNTYRPMWLHGLLGAGIVLSLSDSGIRTSHNQFYDAAYPITTTGVYPNHRKVVAYKNYTGAVFGDNSYFSYHGTHTCGTAAGNDTLLGPSYHDGIAKQARIYFCDIGSNSGLVVSTNLTPLYDTLHSGRGLPYLIYQHSGSWGWSSSSGAYTTQDATTDAYHYAHPGFLSIFSAGNNGSGGRTLGNPAIAKNVLTVGGTGNGTSSNTIYTSSSRGYTADRRIKPNIMAPAVNVYSANGSGDTGYQALSGTSMAAPAVNGGAALIRQYLMAGFYPTGSANPADSIHFTSAALLRAMIMVSGDPNIGAFAYPDSNIGWGRMDLDSVCYFSGDTRRLIIHDDTIGISTGETILDSFIVNSGITLRIAAAWTDTAAAAGAARTLINNLNFRLTSPTGTEYRGSKFASNYSQANPTTFDTLNVEEVFRISSPAVGKWYLSAEGANVPNGPMGYAWAITGDVTPVEVGVHEVETGQLRTSFSVTSNAISTGRFAVKVTLPASGVVNVRLYDITGRVAETVVIEHMAAGEHVIDHATMLANGVYLLEVRAGDDCSRQKLLIVR